jgi:hypothetical protein
MTRKGIDTSHWNHRDGKPIDWAAVRADGYDWVAIKITEATNFVDPFGLADCVGAQEAGLEVVCYHFARPYASGPQAQAQFFEEHIPMQAQNCKRMLDLEDGRQLGWDQLADWTQGFLSAKRTDLVYLPGSYLAGLKATKQPMLVEFVLADPSNDHDRTGMAVVQTGQGHVSGIVGLVDLDDVHYPAPVVGAEPPAQAPGPDDAPAEPSEPQQLDLAAGLPTLDSDSVGGYVAALADLLNARGAGVTVAPFWSDVLQAEVIRFQHEHDLDATGVVGPETWRAILGAPK